MKILIIDDNAHHAELAARRLEQESWEVHWTSQPQVDEKLSEFDFILLDYSMPYVSGLEVLKQIKDIDIATPVIFLTGHGNEVIASEAMKLGAYDYVVKDTQLVFLDRLPTVIREARSKHELIETNRFLIQELKKANENLQKLTFTDEMTGLYNYRFIKNQLDTELKRAERYRKPLSIALIDVDEFKQINDTYGHPTGDLVLKEVASMLTDTLRSVDYVGRYAGDEFLIIFPDTEIEDAVNLAKRLRARISEHPITAQGKSLSVSLSFGVSHYHRQYRSEANALIEAADRALYQAKKSGRNRVEASIRPAPNPSTETAPDQLSLN